MQTSDDYKQILTSLIKKQMMLLGPQVALQKARNITGIVIDDSGTVTDISKNPKDLTDELLNAFMDFPGQVAAKEVIEAQKQQSKEVKHQVEAGWLQIENEKSHLLAALDGMSLGLITTDVELKVQTHNPAVDRILGPNPTQKPWTIDDIQNNIKDQYYLPIECNRAMEDKQPLAPVDVNILTKRVRLFISPIIKVTRQMETTGVTIVMQDLGSQIQTPAPVPPAVPPGTPPSLV